MNIISIRWMAFWHTFTYNSFRRKKNNVLDDFNFWIFFFSWKYNPIFLFSIATRPGEQWYRYCVDTWLQEFIGFFFLFWGGRLCFLSLFTAVVCLHFFSREINYFTEKIFFFQKFVVRYRLCFVSQLWNSHMVLHNCAR